MKVVVEKDEGGPNEMMMMIWSTRATEAAISYCAIAAIERLQSRAQTTGLAAAYRQCVQLEDARAESSRPSSPSRLPPPALPL